jgi:O-antigen biosynthesis protein
MGYLIVFTPYAELYHSSLTARGFKNASNENERFQKEIKIFLQRWKRELDAGDPYYNPNFKLDRSDFSIKEY